MPPRILLSASIFCFLANCTMPAVTPKPLAFQDSAVTVRDWNGVADQIADEMASHGLLPGPLAPQSAAGPRNPYYINLVTPGAPFLREVGRQLQSLIWDHGGTVAVAPAGATVINLDVDVIRWRGDRYPGGLATIAGLAAGTGVMLGDASPLSPAAGFGLAAGAGLVADLLHAATPRTNVEAVWQASAIMGDKLAFDMRRPIYIGASDIPCYASDTHLSAMSSPGAQVAAPAVRLRYDP